MPISPIATLTLLAVVAGIIFWRLLAPARTLKDEQHRSTAVVVNGDVASGRGFLPNWKQFWWTVGSKSSLRKSLAGKLWWAMPTLVVVIAACLSALPYFRPFPLALIAAINIVALLTQALFSRALGGSVVDLEDVRRFLEDLLAALNNPATSSFSAAIEAAWENLPPRALRNDLAPVVDDIVNNARSVTEALHGLSRRSESKDVRALCSQLIMAVQAGSDPAPSVELAVVALDDRVAAMRAIKARIADSKTTMMIARVADIIAIVGGALMAKQLLTGTSAGETSEPISPWNSMLGIVISSVIIIVVLMSERTFFSTVNGLVSREA